MPSFNENFMLESISRKDISRHLNPLKPAEQMVWQQCKNSDQYKMEPTDFVDTYGKDEVERDRLWVTEQKKTEDTETERGKLLESLMIEKAETADWFGEGSFLIPVSEYDDRKAHGDLVLEMENEAGKIVRILIDATASGREQTMIYKMDRSFDILRNEQRLSSVKYFQSEITGQKERLLNIPRVTVGISPRMLGELCAELNKNPKKQGGNTIQLYFLDQMENQLIHLLEAARKIKGVNPTIVQNLENAASEIRNILDKKERLRTNDFMTEANVDPTYQVLAH